MTQYHAEYKQVMSLSQAIANVSDELRKSPLPTCILVPVLRSLEQARSHVLKAAAEMGV